MAESIVAARVEYRNIDGFPGYRVGDDGSVWTRKLPYGRGRLSGDWKRMKVRHDKDGYLTVNLCVEGKKTLCKVHRLVATAFYGPRPNDIQACHENGVRDDCCVTNLRWDTQAGNSADMVRHGTRLTGEKNHQSKLTDQDVREVRLLLASGKTQRSIADQFGVSFGLISHINNGRAWNHVT